MLSFVSLVGLFLALGDCSFAYIAEPRVNHHSTLIGNVLMIYGGQTIINGGLSNTLILLPINQSFDTTSPPYGPNSGVSNSGLGIYGGVMFPGGQNHDELLIYGGIVDGSVELLIYDQELNNFNDTRPFDNGTMPCNYHSAVVNTTLGKAYIFGGSTFPDNNNIALNGLWVLDTVGLVWAMISSNPSSTPLARQAHTATLTTDGRMVVIGGQTNFDVILQMSNIDIFDTISQKWSNVNASNSPQARISHTAVCTHSNQILVFGGIDSYSVALGDLIVLDMNISPLSWSKPNTTGLPPLPRYGHSATIVGTIMFIIYGKVSNITADSNIYALDTTTFTWTTNYTPNHLEYTWSSNFSTENNDGSNSGLSKVFIAVIIISVFIFIGICVVAIYFYYRAKRRRPHCTESEAKNETNSFSQAHVHYGPPHTAEDSQKIEYLEDQRNQTRKPDDVV